MSTHRHKDKRGQWLSTVADGPHGHADVNDRLNDLTRRIEALEAPVTPPPVEPPPVEPPPVEPPPVEPPPAGAFGSYPSLPARGSSAGRYALYESPTDLVIEKVRVFGIGANQRAIVITNPRGTLTLRDIDFQDIGGAIYILGNGGLTDLRIERCRVNRILGPAKVNGARTPNLANFLQMDNVQVKGRIGDNRIIGGDTEDIISITGSSGGAGATGWLDIEDNKIDGSGWLSSSGSGIAGSDGAGGYTRIRRNDFTNPGQVGFFFASGGPGEAFDNRVYNREDMASGMGDQPFYVAKYGVVLPHHMTVARTRADWVGYGGGKRNGHVGTVEASTCNIEYAQIVTFTAAELADMKVVL